MALFNIKHIHRGPAKSKVGHLIFLHARHDSGQQQLPIIYKENIYHPELSVFEVAFSAIAGLFLAPHLTAPSTLVKNDAHQIVGLASEHIRTVIKQREIEAPEHYYQFDNHFKNKEFSKKMVLTPDEIPYKFLDECHPLFFHRLREAEEAGHISLDLSSLAEIFCVSYTLEEDDLHKANIGFYAIEKNGIPHLKFFKIDHDYLLSNSVMSHFKTRMVDAFYGNDAYTISKRDLMNFPVLKDSQNHYWPTVDRLFSLGQKAYHARDERRAYAELSTLPDFKSAKWKAFYRHILIPPALMQQRLADNLDINDPVERAHRSLIMQALVARQAKLRAVLFSIPEFRSFVATMEDPSELIKAMGLADHSPFKSEISASIAQHKAMCTEGLFDEKDTPLHVAIKLQDYRYHETWQAFGHYAEQKNANGEKPLDVAKKLLGTEGVDVTDLRRDPLCTMKHMIREGARDAQGKTHAALIKPSDYLFHSDYPKRARAQENMRDLITLLRDLGEDVRYSLKMQKELALICIKQFVLKHEHDTQLGHMMAELKIALNGTSHQAPAPELQFIRQLRSQLWIVRYIRGLLGGTSTQFQINRLIDQEMMQARPSMQSTSTLFYKKSASEDPSSSQASFDHTSTTSLDFPSLHEPSVTDNQGLPGQSI